MGNPYSIPSCSFSLSTFTSRSYASRTLSHKNGWALKLANNEPLTPIFSWTCKLSKSKISLRSRTINPFITSLLFQRKALATTFAFLG